MKDDKQLPAPTNLPDSLEGSYKDPDKIEWKRAFRVLAYLLGRAYISSDTHIILAKNLQKACGEEVAKEFLIYVGKSRTSFIHDIMG